MDSFAVDLVNVTYYTLRLELVGDVVTGYIDDVEACQATLSGGQLAALGTRGGIFADTGINFGWIAGAVAL